MVVSTIDGTKDFKDQSAGTEGGNESTNKKEKDNVNIFDVGNRELDKLQKRDVSHKAKR